MALYNSKQEFFRKGFISSGNEISAILPARRVFCADRIGYVQVWKYGNTFWLECKGLNGEYFTSKFHGCDMANTCESYFSTLRTGYPLWEV